jgi:hypothetical protein
MIRPTVLAAAAAFALLPDARAFDIEMPDPGLKVRLDLTPKYSAAQRLKDPSPEPSTRTTVITTSGRA